MLFVANYTKLGKFVAKLEKIYIENRQLWWHSGKGKHCFQLVFKKINNSGLQN